MTAMNHNWVDPKTGSFVYDGPSELTKGNHNHMPATTDAYLPTDERGHIQASSLGGSNSKTNIVPQAADLNHGGYYNMEQGARTALRNGSSIQSEKIAFVSNQYGNRPDAFMVNDTITFPDGQTQNVHLSFSNLTNVEQEAMNAECTALASDLYDAYPNPGDALRDSMSPTEYAALMEETDAGLPNISDYYTEWGYDGSGEPTADWNDDTAANPDSAEVVGTDDGAGVSVDDD